MTTQTICARNLPQHFNGCTCTAVPGGLLAEAADIDLLGVTPTPQLGEILDAVADDSDLPGTLLVESENTAIYSDPDGHVYDITADGGAVGVRVRHTSITSEAYPFVGSPSGKTVVGLIRTARETVKDRDSFNAAANEWLKTTDDEKGWGYEEPEFDQDEGTISVRGLTIGGFTRDSQWHHGPEMTVTLAGDTDIHGKEKEPLTFTFARGRTGYSEVFRGEDRKPLEHWEREALDARVQTLMNRGGYLRSLTELYNDASRKAIRGA